MSTLQDYRMKEKCTAKPTGFESTPQYKNKAGSVHYNIRLRGVLATIVAVEKQYVLHILNVCL